MRRTWIKLYVDQTLRGTCFEELEPDERFVWFGFLLLSGDNLIEGKISVTDKVGYTVEQLAGLLDCKVELIERSIKKFVKYGKVKVDKNNVIKICKWEKYQSEYQRQKKYREKDEQKLQPKVTTKSYSKSDRVDIEGDIDIERDKDKKDSKLSGKAKIPYSDIVSYLNKKAKKNFRLVDKTKKLIRARYDEDFTLDDFHKVIDVKTKQWLGDAKMSAYLRPQTLFGTKFEAYLNESPPKEEKIKYVN